MKQSLSFILLFIVFSATSNAGRLHDVKHSKRIVNGQPAKAHEWPWMVSLFNGDRFACGATLIHPQWVLTAAHCYLNDTTRVPLYPTSNLTIRLGEHHLNKDDAVYKTRKAIVVIPHSSFLDSYYGNYDIALIKLSSPVMFTDKINIPTLPNNNEEFPPGTPCEVRGYGNVGTNTSNDGTLLQANQTVVDFQTCQNYYPHFVLSNTQLCASGAGRSCFGDSGGPLMCKRSNGGKSVLAGVVSYGKKPCEFPRIPDVNARVSSFISWIKQTMSSN